MSEEDGSEDSSEENLGRTVVAAAAKKRSSAAATRKTRAAMRADRLQKETLIGDLYADLTEDEEDEDRGSGQKASDNRLPMVPFEKQLIKGAQQMKQRDFDEANHERASKNMEEIKETGQKFASAFRGFFVQAKEKVAIVASDERLQEKLRLAKETVVQRVSIDDI